MGQRANYILVEGGNQTIHYSHWRANRIAADLYLGEKRFLEFVRNCRVNDVLLNEVWIEGCVVIDFLKKGLYFWSCEFAQPSIEGLYLKELRKKWRGWNVNLLYNRIYDVEKILNIDYISKQERRNFTLPSIPENPSMIILKTIGGLQLSLLKLRPKLL